MFISLKDFKQRTVERRMLQNLFIQKGGNFIEKKSSEQDPELSHLVSNLTSTEYHRSLIVSLEKDFCNSKVDIKIYECRLGSLDSV